MEVLIFMLMGQMILYFKCVNTSQTPQQLLYSEVPHLNPQKLTLELDKVLFH